MGCYFPLWGTFLTQGWNPPLLSLLHWRVDSLPLHHLGSCFKITHLISLVIHLFIKITINYEFKFLLDGSNICVMGVSASFGCFLLMVFFSSLLFGEKIYIVERHILCRTLEALVNSLDA